MDEQTSPGTWRLAGFALALVGALLALATALAGQRALAVRLGLRALGAGLALAGATTLLFASQFAAVERPARPPATVLLRGALLATTGGTLAVSPGTVADLFAGFAG